MSWRSSRAFSGGTAPMASSTARTDASACTVVQTPQIRCAKSQASRGSLPCTMVSMPRHIVEEEYAS